MTLSMNRVRVGVARVAGEIRLWLPNVGLILTLMLLSGCSQKPVAPRDPVRDSFYEFVATASGRASEVAGSSRRISFASGRGYTEATADSPATGSVEIRIEGETVVRKILREEPAYFFSDYDLTFEYRDGEWKFKKGTARHKTTKRHLGANGRTADVLEPETTSTMEALQSETLELLFYGKRDTADSTSKP